jgi:hypothetical protein
MIVASLSIRKLVVVGGRLLRFNQRHTTYNLQSWDLNRSMRNSRSENKYMHDFRGRL